MTNKKEEVGLQKKQKRGKIMDDEMESSNLESIFRIQIPESRKKNNCRY